jgi:hypothetical protein
LAQPVQEITEDILNLSSMFLWFIVYSNYYYYLFVDNKNIPTRYNVILDLDQTDLGIIRRLPFLNMHSNYKLK